MLSTVDLENLIYEKRREIETEKIKLGLCEPPNKNNTQDFQKHAEEINSAKEVRVTEESVASQKRDEVETKEVDSERNLYDLAENIPPDLEKYIRRYLGLPVMLKAGEYSPNNPLIRGERTTGDALLGLGEYERRRNTLRKLRQQQYREYLDEQAKKKQEAKEQAEKERRERDEKERLREERERERLQLERERKSPDRRSSLNYVPSSTRVVFSNKVDTGVQGNGKGKPLSVAVQTDHHDIFALSPLLTKCEMTEAERELSPRTVAGGDLLAQRWDVQRRRSYGDHDDTAKLKRSNREKLVSDLRHSYMPSIFDADAISLRNLQAEKEAAAKRQYYQQELKNQIMEQQRIKEERKSREKLLEQAEMRRLEEQLRMLNVAQEREIVKQYGLVGQMKENSSQYEKNRIELQRDIDNENRRLLHAKSQPATKMASRFIQDQATSRSDELPSKLPFHHPRRIPDIDQLKPTKQPNDPETSSLISPDYDVDKYLRRNLNFKINNSDLISKNNNKDTISNDRVSIDTLPVPILRHTSISQRDEPENNNTSDAMQRVEDKWRVPAVQKNLLRNLSKDDGKCLRILTQLGSIRKQLQLEQMKLDNIVP